MKKFTLPEMLIVIAILAILISILLPSISRARKSAQNAVCINNEKQIGRAITAYAVNNNGYFPTTVNHEFISWDDRLGRGAYDGRELTNRQVNAARPGKYELYNCPLDKVPSNRWFRQRRSAYPPAPIWLPST